MYSVRQFTPPFDSSPPSSPNPFLDSSPASSPGLGSFDTNLPDVPALQLSDPFAASVKATRRPPQYEKKRSTPPFSPPSEPSPKKLRRHYQQFGSSDLKSSTYPSSPSDEYFNVSARTNNPEQIEASIWDEASTKVVDEGHGAVNLDNRNLTQIPESFISDLAHFYIPPESSELMNSSPNTRVEIAGRTLARVSTAPPNTFEPSPRLFSRTRSAAAGSFGLPREKLQLFLSSNKITSLPNQLLNLKNLSVLSIRGNLLTYIPPEIVGLINLQTLNLANNKIKFLPAEMLQMSLTQLQIYPNPFIDPPEPPSQSTSGRRPFLRSSTASRTNLWPNERPISEVTHVLPRIIPLVELSFRTLLSTKAANSDETVLERHYNLPLDECPVDTSGPTAIPEKRRFIYPIPSHLRTVLELCTPYALYLDESNPIKPPLPPTGLGVCPSPHHRYKGDKKPIFVRHAEERYSWEQTIAGVRVGGVVPVQWRGCQWGCLDFLDNKTTTQTTHPQTETTPKSKIMAHDTHTMDEDAIQLIQFNATPGRADLDFDD